MSAAAREVTTEGWRVAELGEVCRTTSGGTPSRRNAAYFKGDIPWVKSGELPDGMVLDIEEGITQEAIDNSSAKLFPAGTLLIALYGATIGKLGVLPRAAATNQAICAIFPEDDLDQKYLFWFLRYARSHLLDQAIGGAQPNISQGILRDLQIPIAPMEQQLRIVAEIEKQFSRLDEAVASLKRVKANLKRYKAAVLKAAVEGKLTEEWRKQNPDVEPASKLLERILAERRTKWEEAELAKMMAKGKEPKDDKWKAKYKAPISLADSEASQLPETWQWVTWDELLAVDEGAFRRGPFGSALKKSIFVKKGYKVYEQYCPINDDPYFARYFITEEKYKEMGKFWVKERDFLISCSGVTLGRITQVPDDFDQGVINQALLRVRLNSAVIGDDYFVTLFRSPYFQEKIFDNAQGAAIPNVKGVKHLKSIAIPLPPVDEQEELIRLVETFTSVHQALEGQLDLALGRLSRLRQSVLTGAFSELASILNAR